MGKLNVGDIVRIVSEEKFLTELKKVENKYFTVKDFLNGPNYLIYKNLFERKTEIIEIESEDKGLYIINADNGSYRWYHWSLELLYPVKIKFNKNDKI